MIEAAFAASLILALAVVARYSYAIGFRDGARRGVEAGVEAGFKRGHQVGADELANEWLRAAADQRDPFEAWPAERRQTARPA